MTHRTLVSPLPGLLGLLLLAASPAWTVAQPAGLTITDVWVREAPASRTVTGAYMTLQNASDRDIVLVGGSTPAAKVLELHEMREEAGKMQMRKIDKLVVPPRGTVVLKPGGLHVMLIELTRALAAGAKVPITLTTTDGSSITVEATVRATGAMH